MSDRLKRLILFTTLILLAACREPSMPASVNLAQRPINAVTTIGMIGDIVNAWQRWPTTY
jgi:hypothetical protein